MKVSLSGACWFKLCAVQLLLQWTFPWRFKKFTGSNIAKIRRWQVSVIDRPQNALELQTALKNIDKHIKHINRFLLQNSPISQNIKCLVHMFTLDSQQPTCHFLPHTKKKHFILVFSFQKFCIYAKIAESQPEITMKQYNLESTT